MHKDSSLFATMTDTLVRKGAALVAFCVVFGCGVAVGTTRWPPLLALKAGGHPLALQRADNSATGHASHDAYELATHRQSYFKLDAEGSLELRDKLPFRAENTYHLTRRIEPRKTAVVIMDPWVDMASQHLNEYYGRVATSRIVPLVEHAMARGHAIIVLTNHPQVVDYNTKIHPALATLAAQGKASILYHQDLDDDAFASHLRSKEIDSLIYVGFASNMCVIGRRMGMIPMVHHGFRLFFVPQASAAVEFPDSWESQSIHQACTKIISQWIAEIVDYDEFMRATATTR